MLDNSKIFPIVKINTNESIHYIQSSPQTKPKHLKERPSARTCQGQSMHKMILGNWHTTEQGAASNYQAAQFVFILIRHPHPSDIGEGTLIL